MDKRGPLSAQLPDQRQRSSRQDRDSARQHRQQQPLSGNLLKHSLTRIIDPADTAHAKRPYGARCSSTGNVRSAAYLCKMGVGIPPWEAQFFRAFCRQFSRRGLLSRPRRALDFSPQGEGRSKSRRASPPCPLTGLRRTRLPQPARTWSNRRPRLPAWSIRGQSRPLFRHPGRHLAAASG